MGGGRSNCTATAPGFDGTQLTRLGDVVVITVNHRLNVFGYLNIGGDDGLPRRAVVGDCIGKGIEFGSLPRALDYTDGEQTH